MAEQPPTPSPAAQLRAVLQQACASGLVKEQIENAFYEAWRDTLVLAALHGLPAENFAGRLPELFARRLEKAGPAALPRESRAILTVLLKYDPVVLCQTDIEATLAEEAERDPSRESFSRRTIQECLTFLRACGLTHRPHGERSGEGLTPDGRILARALFAP